jgi:hypothetical protein
MRYLGFSLLIAVLCAALAGEQPDALPAAPDCKRAYRETIEKINSIHRKEGFPIVPLEEGASFSLQYDRYYRTKLGTVGYVSKSAADAGFLGPRCEPITFFNHAATAALCGKNARLYDEPTKPSWSPEAARALATRYIRAFIGDEKLRSLRPSQPTYEHPMQESPRYYVGEWWVSWRRVTPEGHEFSNDCACVMLSETHGILCYRLSCHSIYEGRPRKRLNKEDCLALAEPCAKKVAGSIPARAWFRKLEVGGRTGAHLKVVNPNHIDRMRNLEELGNPGDQRARLAWVVTFAASYPYNVEGEPDTRRQGEIRVWIDAETGEFLGGDFK